MTSLRPAAAPVASLFVALLLAPALRTQNGCPETPPPDPAFVPPAPHPRIRSGSYYVGSEKLWVFLPTTAMSGSFTASGIRVKFPWFAGDLTSDDAQTLQVSGRRLDGSAPPLALEGPHYAQTGDRNALTSALLFPERGCWEITAKRQKTELKFVVRVK